MKTERGMLWRSSDPSRHYSPVAFVADTGGCCPVVHSKVKMSNAMSSSWGNKPFDSLGTTNIVGAAGFGKAY